MFLSEKYTAMTICMAFLLVSIGVSQEMTLQIRPDRDDGIYRQGETATFHVTLEQDGAPLEGREISWLVQGDGNYRDEGTITSCSSGADIQARLEHPGFLLCTVTVTPEEGKPLHAVAGAGVEPLQLASTCPEPDDFDRFWAEKLAEQAALDMDPKLVPLDTPSYAEQGVAVFDLKLAALGEKPVSGYLVKPLDAKKGGHPIIVTYHGAGVYSAYPRIPYAKRGMLVLDINAHGIENGQPREYYETLSQEELLDYRYQNANDRDHSYFTGMYLRAVRALDYMKTLPEWDGKTIIVEGSSQGGGQALVVAGLRPEVTHCIAYVPGHCFHTGFLDGMFGGGPKFLLDKTPETADPKIVATVPYVDAAIHAKRIRAFCVLSAGFIDTTCSPTSIYVAYNNIPSPKRIIAVPDMGHQTDDQIREEAWKIINEQLQK